LGVLEFKGHLLSFNASLGVDLLQGDLVSILFNFTELGISSGQTSCAGSGVVRSETKKTNPAMIPIFFMVYLLVEKFDDV
jgi:hypothetical protein